MGRRRPEAITRDQEFYSAILLELKELRLQITAIAQAVSGGPPSNCICEVCGKGFANERALRSHSRVHKE